MGQTSPDALRWPEYADPAAVPQDMQELATDVQRALDIKALDIQVRRPLVVKYSGFSRAEDVNLTADVAHNITFTSTYAQPANTTPSLTHTISGWSRFVVPTAGLYTFELDISVYHPGGTKTDLIEIGVNNGSEQVPSATFTVVNGTRVQMHLSQEWRDSFYIYVKPSGAGATGWQLLYARLVLMGV